jgi:hypothetical protein
MSTLSPKALALLNRVPDAGDLFFMVPADLRSKTVLTAAEVARIIKFRKRTVLDEAQNGRLSGTRTLEHYGPNGRTRTEWKFTMRGVMLWLAERWNGNTQDMPVVIEDVLRTLPVPQLMRVAQFCTAEIQRRPKC